VLAHEMNPTVRIIATGFTATEDAWRSPGLAGRDQTNLAGALGLVRKPKQNEGRQRRHLMDETVVGVLGERRCLVFYVVRWRNCSHGS
jgi:hypothetical protein